ncbi:MAG: DNA polymerase III subunit chi [Pseudomonadota bacterium]|jgi:DNA polymerase-3 subunit chi
MTQIDFYTHVADKHRIACILSAKALEQGLRVVIYTPDAATTDRVGRLLWSVPATGFLPHCRAADPLAEMTPVIVDHEPEPFSHDQVLLNLASERPPFFSRFQRLIEIVSTDEDDRLAARDRFRFYRDRGYEIRSHDLSNHGKPAE